MNEARNVVGHDDRSAEAEVLGGEELEPDEGVGQELAGEEVAGARGLAVVHAGGALPDGHEELRRDLLAVVPGGVGPAEGPVDPGDGAVGVAGAVLDVDEGGEVVLVGVAAAVAVLLEDVEVVVVGDDADGHLPVDLEPLGALPPLVQADLRQHLLVPPPPPHHPLLVEHAHERLLGVYQVGVDGREVEHRHARLRQQHEPLVRVVQQRVRQQPPLRLHQVHVPPRHVLHAGDPEKMDMMIIYIYNTEI